MGGLVLIAQQGALASLTPAGAAFFLWWGTGSSRVRHPTPNGLGPRNACVSRGAVCQARSSGATRTPSGMSGFWKERREPRAAGRGQDVPASRPCPRVTPPPPAPPHLIKGPSGSFLRRERRGRERRAALPRGALSINAGPHNLHLICERFKV